MLTSWGREYVYIYTVTCGLIVVGLKCCNQGGGGGAGINKPY